MIETRNGSAQVFQQYVWGTQYIDELVQVGVNQDPQNEDPNLPAGQRENLAERFFWVCQDANYNVLGVLSAAPPTVAGWLTGCAACHDFLRTSCPRRPPDHARRACCQPL